MILLSSDWQVVSAGPTRWIDFVNSSRQRRTVYIRLDGQIRQKTLGGFTMAACKIDECKELAIRQSGSTRDITAEVK